MSESHDDTCRPGYGLLSNPQIERLHQATLEVLWHTGVRVLHPEACDMLADAGCRVSDQGRVQIPARVVEQAIAAAPSTVTVYNRLGQPAMSLTGRNSYFGLGTDLPRTWDLDTGQLRDSCLEDVARAATLGDACPEIDFVASYALAYDAPTHLLYIDSVRTELLHTIKPLFFTAAGWQDLAIIHQMAGAIAGGSAAFKEKPFLIHYAEPTSPMAHARGSVDRLFFCADKGIPITCTPGLMSGGSAPVTLAGAMVQGNAEALSGVVLHQLRSPGAPIISGFGSATLDMATAVCAYGAPEYRLGTSAMTDLYRHYGIPMWGTAGASDSVCLDAQAGMEWGVSLLLDAMSGANLIHDVGYLGQGMVGHPAAIVMCDEIISYIRRILAGFSLDPTSLAQEVIQEIGPRGHYLSHRHTRRNYKTAHWRSQLANRQSPQNWLDMGAQTWPQQAFERTRDLLTRHQTTPLAPDLRQALADIREAAATALQEVQFAC